MRKHLLVALVAVATLAGVAGAQITQLGTLAGDSNSKALGISGDGLTVVGVSGQAKSNPFFGPDPGDEGFYWRVGTGMVGIGAAPGMTTSAARAANYDGRYLVGVTHDGVGSSSFDGTVYWGSKGFRYDTQTGTYTILATPAGGGSANTAFDISDDGSVIVGGTATDYNPFPDPNSEYPDYDPAAWEFNQWWRACRWDNGVVSYLPDNPKHLPAVRGYPSNTWMLPAVGVSGDGSIVTGHQSGSAGTEGFVDTSNGADHYSIVSPIGPRSWPRGISRDGSTAVGSWWDPNEWTGASLGYAYKHSYGDLYDGGDPNDPNDNHYNATTLGNIEGTSYEPPESNIDPSQAFAVSEDGSVVVGKGTGDAPIEFGGQIYQLRGDEALIHHKAIGTISLAELVFDKLGMDDTGWTYGDNNPTGKWLAEATGIADYDPCPGEGNRANFDGAPRLRIVGRMFNSYTYDGLNLDGIDPEAFLLEIPNFVPGDANLDGKVDVSDLGILAGNWSGSEKDWFAADFTGDGVVDVGDLGVLAGNWGYDFSGCAVPEPATLTVLAMGGLALLRRRK